MRVTMTPNGGRHEIVCDKIIFDTPAKVNDHMRYLATVRDMLWNSEQEATADTGDDNA